MSGPRLVDPELVVHVFAPLDGPTAEAACRQLLWMWEACRDPLGLTNAVHGIGLPPDPAPDWLADPTSRALAARERPGADFQAILRREHDVLSLSIVFASPQDSAGLTHRRRLRIGSAAPPGWVEFDRWWSEIAAAGSPALLGEARLYQAKFAGRGSPPLARDLARAASGSLPPGEQDHGWTSRELAVTGGLTAWEVSPRRDDRAVRRLLLLAPADGDSRLSAFTWSRGDPAMPPLARYLMHAAKLRYHVRVWLTQRPDVDQIRRRLAESVGQSLPGLPADRGAAVATVARLRELRLVVDMLRDNMMGALADRVGHSRGTDLVADDHGLATWLAQQIDDALALFDIADRSARDLAALPRSTDGVRGNPSPDRSMTGQPDSRAESLARAQPDPPQRFSSTVRSGAPPKTSIRMGFTLDVSAYSTRSDHGKADAQERVAAIVGLVLRDLGLEFADTDHQGLGDGLNLLLPERVAIGWALPNLLRSITGHLARDNAGHTDRLRLRMAVAVGPTGLAAMGFSGSMIIECGRLVDSEPIRRALLTRPETDLAVLISDTVHKFVVNEGAAGIGKFQFQKVAVAVKEYAEPAWLWVALPQAPPVSAAR